MPLTVVLVEPDPTLRDRVAARLREEGHRLWAFAGPAGALEALGEGSPQLALIAAVDDPALDVLEKRLREPGVRCQVVWIAPPGESGVEALARRHRPRGLLARSTLVEDAVQLTRRVEKTQVRSRALLNTPAMIGRAPAVEAVRRTMEAVSSAGAPTVLITGESGTGKEVVARNLHALGLRADGPFIEVDCAAIPSTLLESELFGHEAGTFTDARESKMGLMELAQGGTVFLDEIGEMEFALQAKLLRILDSRRLRRLGGREEIPLDVHLIAATNRDLEQEVREGRFRADLFYRLDVVRIHLPPLRDRNGDIPLLAERFLEDACRRLGRTALGFAPSAVVGLTKHPWPGNIRELRNHIERLALAAPADATHIRDAAVEPATGPAPAGTVRIDLSQGPVPWDEIERTAIHEALRVAEGNVSEAARLLGLGRGALRYRMVRQGFAGSELAPERRAA